jgi:hypothetical protein
MAGKNSLLDDLYTDSGGFDAERAADVLKALLTIQRGTHAVFFKKGGTLKEEEKVLAYSDVPTTDRKLSDGQITARDAQPKSIHQKYSASPFARQHY